MKQDYEKFESTINAIRGSLRAWEAKKNNPQCDKRGFGFNQDPRFRSFGVELGFDNWAGYYGSSSCSTWFHCGDSELFKGALVQVLNRHALELFAEVADQLEKESTTAKADEVAKLKQRLEELQK